MNQFSRINRAVWSCAIVLWALTAAGCRSSSYAARNTAETARGPFVGSSLDDIDARNRESIAAQLGRPVAPGPATPAEVAAMTHAGVPPQYIVSYINRSTNVAPITAQDVIYLHEQGVDEQVIQAMLTPGSAYSRADVARAMPPRVLILGYPWWYYDDPYCEYPRYGVATAWGYRRY